PVRARLVEIELTVGELLGIQWGVVRGARARQVARVVERLLKLEHRSLDRALAPDDVEARCGGVTTLARTQLGIERVVWHAAVVLDVGHVAVGARKALLVRRRSVGLARVMVATLAAEDVGLRALVRAPVRARDRVAGGDVLRDVLPRLVAPDARVR